MERTITVKGTGKVSSRPDLIVIQLDLISRAPRYEETMNQAAAAVAELQKAISKAGFEKEALKTSDFSIDTEYEHFRDKHKDFKSRFIGFVCKQNTKLEFDLDTKRLSDVIGHISSSRAEPKLSIRFTMKDPDAVEEELLVNAAESAKKRAELLAKGTGAALDELLSIHYTWGELHMFSPTSVMYEEDIVYSEARMPEIEPDEIKVSDTATFVWSLK